MLRYFLAVLLAAPLVAGCLTSRTSASGPVEWGSSFGMCVGYCSARLVVADGTATLTETGTRSPELAPRVRTRALTPAETARLAEARAASRVATDTLGCPDCADGGAEYVEAGGQRVIFEFGADAGGATPLAEALRAIRQTFPSDPSGL
ncbi:MAG TPA: hypothetical protein VGB53_06405 [Rubricoccaceae bacterium]|jgi:hypothetical protein